MILGYKVRDTRQHRLHEDASLASVREMIVYYNTLTTLSFPAIARISIKLNNFNKRAFPA